MTDRTYTAKQVCVEVGISKSTLVRWEKKGVFPRPKRLARNRARIFTDDHLKLMKQYKEKVLEESPPAPSPSQRAAPERKPPRSKRR